ncbi:MAG: tRNA threonylcarbamoyladenosine dehydratase, partial [Chloroflexia bacterium]|nr:tRNA threonylcarbamoyladenosine dehydratase [Chloroflexia bacterium]
NIESYDYVIDAIDSLSNKIHLINTATKTNAKLFSSMGSSLKIDPTRIQVAKFWDVKGCPLASRLRKSMRRWNHLPSKEFLCVYSDEIIENKGVETQTCGSSACLCPKSNTGPGNQELINHEWCSHKAVINGTTSHITAIFGFTLAGLVIKDISSGYYN